MRLYTKYKRLRPRRKKSPNGALPWLLVLGCFGFLGWVWWHYGEGSGTTATAPNPIETRRPTNSSAATKPPAQAEPVLEAPSTETTNIEAPPPDPYGPVTPPPAGTRNPRGILEAQIALARQGISCGSVDGVMGSQTRAALRAFQQREGLPVTGQLDAVTIQRLFLSDPVTKPYSVGGTEIARLMQVPAGWLGKSQQDRLDYENIVELLAELGHCHPSLVRSLNPGIDWAAIQSGAKITLPSIDYPSAKAKGALIRIRLQEKVLQVFDSGGTLLAHFPCSIARRVEKRPVGQLQVEKVALMPVYRFDPQIFSESAEARAIGRPLMIPAGPNNPVGTAWIGLNRPGYGIHGTPRPEDVGRTESHGCFRLANWNAQYLAELVTPGTPVHVEL